jgi:hypothetical protein
MGVIESVQLVVVVVLAVCGGGDTHVPSRTDSHGAGRQVID